MAAAEDALSGDFSTIIEGVGESISDPVSYISDELAGLDSSLRDATGIGMLGSDAADDVSDDLSGKTAKESAEKAAETQAAAAEEAAGEQLRLGREAIAFQKESRDLALEGLAPFREIGTSAIGGLPALLQAQQSTIDDPSSRVLNNPFFKALAEQQEQRLLQSAAARGKVGSGGTAEELQQNLLLLGNQFAQQDIANQQLGITNLQNLSTIGANAAAGQGSTIQQTAGMTTGTLGNIGAAQAQGITGAANALAAGQIAGANAQAQGTQNMAGLAMMAASMFSDARLKENIKFSHVENGINIYKWNWTDEAKVLVGDQVTTGPIAQELQKTHPELVYTDPETGYLKVLM